MTKTPLFFTKRGIISTLFLPFAILFLIVTNLRKLFCKSVIISDKKIICIGNVTVGGAGKTPIAIEIGKMLKKDGLDVCFATKGYLRKRKGFFKVEEQTNSIDCGDEAKLLSFYLPTFVFSKVKDLQQIPHKIIILDDGMQNPTIQKDYTILVLDSDF